MSIENENVNRNNLLANKRKQINNFLSFYFLFINILVLYLFCQRRDDMQNIILKCENLHKSFRKKEILKGVSLEIHEGDILGFIGPNGAGKTTTIKLILGLQKINSGNVVINGYNIKSHFEKAIAKVGAIIENPDLYMYMSGFDNLRLIANLYPHVTTTRINEVIKLVGLEKRINDKVSKYSLGMRQRLGVAQAILHKPNLLILDEPTNGLDPEGIKDLRKLLIKLSSEEHMGILISSHNLAELESFCNRVCIIKNGAIVETSDLDTVKKEASEGNFVIELDDAKRARLIVGDISNLQDNTHLQVHVNKENIPFIIKKLVLQDLKIYSITEDIISLEDAFLKKTGGNVID